MDQNNYTDKITIDQVTSSIECTRSRKFVKFYVFLSVIMLLEVAVLAYIFSINDNLQNKVEASCLLGAMYGLAFVIMLTQIVYNVCRIKSIERGVGTLPIYKVAFEKVVTSVWGGTRFVLEIPNGSGVTVRTRPMFVSVKPANITKPRALIPTLYVDDFIGKEVLVMYNSVRNKVYVLDFAYRFDLSADTF